MVFKARGQDAWSYDTLCALCKGIIGAGQTVYVVGQHVLHEECLEKLLGKPRREFEEILSYLPLDTHEELKKLYEEKQRLPPRGTGLEMGTAREGEERGRGKPLSEVERALRHGEQEAKRGVLIPLKAIIEEAKPEKPAPEKIRVLEEFKDSFWTIYHCVEEADEERWKHFRREKVVEEALRKAEAVDRVFNISPPSTFKDLLEALARHADEKDWCSALGDAAAILWKIIYLYEDIIKGKDPNPPQEEENLHEERVLTREERGKLWGLARSIVDEALKEAGHRHPSEMRVDGLSSDYAKFLLALRERLLQLVKEPQRLELKVETYGKGYGDTHVHVDGEYMYTWRPEFDTIRSSFWGWVKRVYNLLKTLAEADLLKEEVLKDPT